jgi:diacylglycerol O-acyltransferase
MGGEQLSGLDTAFLCLEGRTRPMHIGALAVFAPTSAVCSKRLVEMIGDRASQVPKLRRRIGTRWWPPGAAYWVDDPHFARDYHVHAHQLPTGGIGIGGQERDPLVDRMSAIMAEPLDLARPPWQIHLITGLTGNRFALLVKLHHALADGLSAVELGLRLFDGHPGMQRRSPGAAKPAPPRHRLPLLDPVGMVTAAGNLAKQASQVFGIASSALGSALRTSVASPLVAASSPDRDVALVRLDLAEVKQVRRHHGGTVNDLLIAVVSGALREWLLARGDTVVGLPVRALIPVSRRHRSTGAAGNELSGYLCDLPVGEPDAERRLHLIRAAMDRNKAAGPDRGPGAIAVLAEQLPPAVHRIATPLVGSAATLLYDTIITNVPLPGLSLALDGAPLREVYPLVPLGPNQALGVALSTYRNNVYIGLQADRSAIPDLQGLADAIPRALWTLAPEVSWPVASAAAR